MRAMLALAFALAFVLAGCVKGGGDAPVTPQSSNNSTGVLSLSSPALWKWPGSSLEAM